jgi:aminomethyltransferase
MTHFTTKVPLLNNLEILVCRCGYTGEDGFEISVKTDQTEKFVDLLLQNPKLKPAGLGARDSLRLEAGLCLHGNDMNDTLSPAACTLMWTVRKQNQNLEFLGQKALENEIAVSYSL